jgi:hypothetical protein
MVLELIGVSVGHKVMCEMSGEEKSVPLVLGKKSSGMTWIVSGRYIVGKSESVSEPSGTFSCGALPVILSEVVTKWSGIRLPGLWS